MININTKIHDKFSLEFKVGFTGDAREQVADFSINTWLFIPYSLDINNSTYSKDQFYRDVKSNIRLITPEYELLDLSSEKEPTLRNMRQAGQLLLKHPTAEVIDEYVFQVRMFAAIFKSALRDATRQMVSQQDVSLLSQYCEKYISDIQHVLNSYRQCEHSQIKRAEDVFSYADEYMSHLADMQVTKVLARLHDLNDASLDEAKHLLTQFLLTERAYKKQMGYSHLDATDAQAVQHVVRRHSLLKKNIESALYLKLDSEPDGVAAKQITFGMAAGIAMIISTLIALPFQKYFGSYPLLIFAVLVIAYMFKDRIKELIRNRFAGRLKHKYFDTKSIVIFKNKPIGWIKEGMDFINDKKTPGEVLAIRNRSGLESDNNLLGECTILYRKQVHIDHLKLTHFNTYTFPGIHDILRLHIQQLTQKMDDPEITIQSINDQGAMQDIATKRTYLFHIVLQFVHGGQRDYRGFRVTASRNGIESITELETQF